MAGTLHQGILNLFQDDPWLAFDLLQIPRPVDGTPIDRRAEVEVEITDPFQARQNFPDLVLVYEDIGEGGIVITVEAQNEADRHKRWAIPAYQALQQPVVKPLTTQSTPLGPDPCVPKPCSTPGTTAVSVLGLGPQ